MITDWQAEYAAKRDEWIGRIRSASTLDAAFLLYYYNNWRRNWGPRPGPLAIANSEIYPEHYPESGHEAEARAEKMYKSAFEMISGMHEARSRGAHYPDIYESSILRFKAANPGFDESSYELAIHAANVEFR